MHTIMHASHNELDTLAHFFRATYCPVRTKDFVSLFDEHARCPIYTTGLLSKRKELMGLLQ